MTQELREQTQLTAALYNFEVFTSYVKVLDFNSKQIVPFQYAPHLSALETAIQEHRFIVLLKSRQIWCTWFLAAYSLWIAQFQGPAHIPILSQGQKEANQIIERIRFIRKHLPKALVVRELGDAANEIKLANDSIISAMPSTEGAGRSATGSWVIMDEADFHPYFDDNFNAILPIVDAPGSTARFLVLSTRNPSVARSGFTDLYRAAPGNTWRPLFLGWRSRPGADLDWYNAAYVRAKDKQKFRIEHPATAAEALLSIGGLSPFEPDALDRLRLGIRPPIETRNGGVVHLWVKPQVGRKYVAFTDTSHGLGGGHDFGITVILDAQDKVVVADVASNLLKPDRLVDYSIELLNDYWNPLWGIEDTGVGQSTIGYARKLQYPHLWKHQKRNGEKGDYGWHPDERNRDKLWEALISSVNCNEVTVYSDTAVTQLQDIIYRERAERGDPAVHDSRIRIEAASGGHDDYPTALGGALLLAPYATVGKRHTGSTGAPSQSYAVPWG